MPSVTAYLPVPVLGFLAAYSVAAWFTVTFFPVATRGWAVLAVAVAGTVPAFGVGLGCCQ